jgi:hypoxanthine phosphoribosyltransferase
MKVLLDAGAIQRRVAEMAVDIRRDVPDRLHFIAILKGSFVFLSDLIRQIEGSLSLDFMALSSYAGGTRSSGEVRLLKDLDMPIEGQHVVVVEDIVESGVTLAYLHEILRARGPRTLRTACLLDKPAGRRHDVRLDYVGFTIPDEFVVGYGLDHADHYRNLPYIGVPDL